MNEKIYNELDDQLQVLGLGISREVDLNVLQGLISAMNGYLLDQIAKRDQNEYQESNP